MLEWALQCARQGLRVHPLYEVGDDLVCRCWQREKCEEKSRGKHPRLREWQKQASADVEQVTRWWTQWPTAGIGVATGEQSRVWVLDLDGEAAIEWYKDQCRTHGMVKTIGARTGRGRHLWWEWTGADIGCSGVNEITLRQVLASFTAQERRQLRFAGGRKIRFETDIVTTQGPVWLEPYALATLGADGSLQLQAKGMRNDWLDPRYAEAPAQFRGTRYCHLVAPEYLRRLLLGEVQPSKG